MLTVGSLFSGIGGFDLGFERAGMRTLWFCEQDPYCQRVLAKHWPGVPCYPDVRALVADTAGGRWTPQESPSDEPSRGGWRVQSPGPGDGHRPAGGSCPARGGRTEVKVPVPVPYVDILCGGFPCQDLSYAGKGAGIDGERSGLWSEYARLVRELRPRYVVVENVPALLGRGLGRVLGDLAACGYDAEWDCIPAAAVGAPHRRDRLWLVAYPNGTGGEAWAGDGLGVGTGSVAGQPARSSGSRNVADPDGEGPQGYGRSVGCSGERSAAEGGAADRSRDVADTDPERRDGRTGELGPGRRGEPADPSWWLPEPDVGRVAHGVPNRVDRLRALGNALVPQIAEWIGRRILEAEELRDAA